MIPRIFMGLGMLGSIALIAGLFAYLSWDSAQGREIWVEVHQRSPARTELHPSLLELRYASERRPWMHLEVDERGLVVGAERHSSPEPLRPETVVIHAPRELPRAHRAAEGPEPSFALYRVSPRGTAYLIGVADEDRAMLERGD